MLANERVATSERPSLQSAIYSGWVRHRRFVPKHHQFRYPLFMMYIDLSELEELFTKSRFWSVDSRNIAYLKRADYFGDPSMSIDQSLRQYIQAETGLYPKGPIRMLSNLRYFGFVFNPITCYYVFNSSEQLEFIVAEVTNTPWGEKKAYVLRCDPGAKRQRIFFKKEMHVSPFNPMDIEYEWANNSPAKSLVLHMRNWRNNDMQFDATLCLTRQEINAENLRKTLWRYPFMTLKVIASIYWQALKLFIKKVPLYPYPKTKLTNKEKSSQEA